MAPDQLAVSPYQTYGQVIPRPTYSPGPYIPQQRAPSVWDTYRTMFAQPEPGLSPMQSAVQGVRHSGEGAAMAALLALAYRHFGTLDIAGKFPVDGILGALLFALSVKNAGATEGYAGDLRALSQSCTDVFVFRKLAGLEHKTQEPGKLPAPQVSGDPILDAARAAGF